jgi:PAS domain S-box-containing protein
MHLRQKLLVAIVATGLIVLVMSAVSGTALWQIQSALQSPDVPRDAVAAPAELAWWLVVSTGVIGAVVVGATGWWLFSGIAAPVGVLIESIDRLRDGNLDIDVPLDRDDEFGRMASALNDMTDSLQRRTVSRSYLDDVLDSMAEMLFVVDENNRIDHVNLAAMERLGFSREEMKGRSLDDLLEGDAPLPSPDDTVFRRTGSVTEIERRLRTSDGSTLPVLVSRSLLRGSSADAPDIVCVAQDISARKEAEEQLRDSLQEKEVLLREIHHRVKNNLQVIASLLHVQSKKVEDENARRLFAESQDRIRSMAFIHERLYQSDDLAQVDFGAYLDRLTEHLYRSHGVALRDVTCHLETDSAVLGVDRAIPAGLIINELVSNALEHAFPEDSTGTINVSFTTEDEVGTIVVADDGVGIDDAADLESERTLGMRLVNGLVRQLRGEVDVNGTDGLHFTITFPLTDES